MPEVAGATGVNRRRFPRRTKPFRAVYCHADGARVPAVGLDLSGGGLCLLMQVRIPDEQRDTHSVIALVNDAPVPVAAKISWKDAVSLKGKAHFRYGMRLTKIADKDFERVMRWTLADSHAATIVREGTTLTPNQRDALLPMSKQQKIFAALVQRKRLDAVDDLRLPLVEYKFDGYAMREGVAMYALTVRSRVTKDRQSVAQHKTRILMGIDTEGLVVLD